jgi:hypothetical protein
MLESHNFLDVQLVLTCGFVLRDLVDQQRDFGHWRIHAVEYAQFEGHSHLREALCPVGLDLAIFDLLGARDDLRQLLAFNPRRYPVVRSYRVAHRRPQFPPAPAPKVRVTVWILFLLYFPLPPMVTRWIGKLSETSASVWIPKATEIFT